MVYLRFQGAWCHELSDKNDDFSVPMVVLFPVIKEAYNVGMLQFFQHLSFFLESLALTLVPFFILQQNFKCLIFTTGKGLWLVYIIVPHMSGPAPSILLQNQLLDKQTKRHHIFGVLDQVWGACITG